MTDAEKMLLSDAIETAVKAEKCVIVYRRIIAGLLIAGGLYIALRA